MLLAAHSLGLGACWINQLKYCGDKAEVADYLEGLGIDKDMQVVGMVGMGYPDEEREVAYRNGEWFCSTLHFLIIIPLICFHFLKFKNASTIYNSTDMFCFSIPCFSA